MSSTCLYRRQADVAPLFAKLGACTALTLISAECAPFPELARAEKLRLTLKELLDRRPVYAFTADPNLEHDRIVIRDQKLKIQLSAESNVRFGLVKPPSQDKPKPNNKNNNSNNNNQKKKKRAKVKGYYEYNLAESLNKRLVWAMENTITAKWEFWVSCEEKSGLVAEKVEMVVPPLREPRRAETLKRSHDESEASEASEPEPKEPQEDLDLLGFDDWANEIVEWAGLAALRSPLVAPRNPVDPAIANYFAPEHSEVQECWIAQFRGVFDAQSAAKLWDAVAGQKWALLVVNGAGQMLDRPVPVGRFRGATRAKVDGNGLVLVKGEETGVFDFLGY